MPAGTVRCGDLTRSETWAIVSNPWKATKNIPAASVIPGTGPGESGDPNFAERFGTVTRAIAPATMNATIRPTLRTIAQGILRVGAADRRVPAATKARNTTTASAFSETLYVPPARTTPIGMPGTFTT